MGECVWNWSGWWVECTCTVKVPCVHNFNSFRQTDCVTSIKTRHLLAQRLAAIGHHINCSYTHRSKYSLSLAASYGPKRLLTL